MSGMFRRLVKAVLEIVSPLGYTGDTDLGHEEVHNTQNPLIFLCRDGRA